MTLHRVLIVVLGCFMPFSFAYAAGADTFPERPLRLDLPRVVRHRRRGMLLQQTGLQLPIQTPLAPVT